MKKFLLYVSAAAAMMLAGSCQKEALAPVSEGETSVKFSIALPDVLQTKAMSMAESTDIVYYEIWNSNWTRQLYPVEQAGIQSAYASAKVNSCRATIDLKLVSDQTYNFIFWAQNEACGAYNVDNLKNVGVDYDVIGAEGNQDKFDAFYAIETIRVEGPINKTVTLYRPFAQLNFGADEMTTTFGDIVVTDTEIKVSGLATVFNTITGYGEKPVTEPVAFQANGIATDETLVAAGKPYTWVAMDYMLMMDNQALVNVEASFGVDGMDEPVTHSLTNVPLKKNYRTNIVGDLFTTDAKLNIIVDPAFEAPDHIIGEDWTQTGDFKYTVNAGAQAGTLKAILEHAHSEAVRGGLKDVVVTVELKGDVDWVTGASHGSTPLIAEGSPIVAVIINGNDNTFTATGAGVGPIRMANGGKLTFNKVKIVDQSVSYNEGAWELGYLEMGGNLELNNCQVVNAIMVSDNFAANGTSFNSNKDSEYAVWVDGGKASFTGSTFAGPRGLKIHEAYGSEVAEVLVDACTFDHISKKPGIAMGDLNAETSVTVKTSLFDGCQAGDQGLYMYETDTDVTTFNFVREDNIVIGYDAVAVLQENGSYIAATADAINDAYAHVEDNGIINIVGHHDGVFLLNKTINTTVQGLHVANRWEKSASIAGKMGVAYGNVTFRNLAFKVSANTSGATSNNLVNKAGEYIIPMYSADVTVENCSFTGMTDTAGAVYYYANTGSAAVPEKLTVKNSTFTGERALRARANVEVTGCTFYGLLNPALQIVGIGETAGTVTFTDNTSDNYISGVTIKTGNQAAKNITFNVGRNQRCNIIAYDGKNLGNLYPETYTYTGEVTTIIPEDEKGLEALMADAQVSEIVLAPGVYESSDIVYINSCAKTVKSAYAESKALLKGKYVASKDVKFENVAFAPSAVSAKDLVKATYGSYVNGTYAAIVTVNKVAATFEGCEFNELNGAVKASAINYFQDAAGKALKVNNCSFKGAVKAIYTKVLCEITNSTFDLNGGVPVYAWPRANGSTDSFCTFTGNTFKSGVNRQVGLLSQSAPFANVVFNVQNNAGENGGAYGFVAAARCATDGSVTFAPGSATFSIAEDGKMF